MGDRRSPRLLFAVAGNLVRRCIDRPPPLSRGIIDLDRARLDFHRRHHRGKSSGPRHHLRLFRPRQQKLELHCSCRARFVTSRCIDRDLGVREYMPEIGFPKAPGLNLSVEASSSLRSERELPLRSYVHALRYSPAGSRIAMARQLFPYLFRSIARSAAEICEFDSLKNYQASYRRLAQFLGHGEKASPPGEIDFLLSVQNRGAHPGTISLREFLLLTAFTSILAPQRAIEIGTLAGFSAAIIAAAI